MTLTRLHYFDGLFLRAELLRRDQDGLRELVFQSNVADGPGIAFGLEASSSGGMIAVQPGLAVDGQGRVVLLTDRAEARLTDLLGTGGGTPQPANGGDRFAPCVDLPSPGHAGGGGGTSYYAVVLSHAESACGWEEVRGRACENACEADMERPYIVESARIRLCPVTLRTKLPQSRSVPFSEVHLQSRVATAFFADEQERAQSLIYGAGIRSTVWCAGAALPDGLCGDDVPVALIGVKGGSVVLFDSWIARRERMEPPPRRYWGGRMRMRPWDVYLAQVLQFQCQLAEALGGQRGGMGGGLGGLVPIALCGDTKALLGEALHHLNALGVQRKEVVSLSQRVRAVLRVAPGSARILIDLGFVTVPPAAWMPYDPQSDTPLSQQMADLMGPGVDLRFVAVRADQVAGEFESCQHLDRISLTAGIDDPAHRELVDILVPDGEVGPAADQLLFEVDMTLSPQPVELETEDGRRRAILRERAASERAQVPLAGVARLDVSGAGPAALYAALASGVDSSRAATSVWQWVNALLHGGEARPVNAGIHRVSEIHVLSTASALLMEAGQPDQPRVPSLAASSGRGNPIYTWLAVSFENNPFLAGQGGGGACAVESEWLMPVKPAHALSLRLDARYTVTEVLDDGVEINVRGSASGHQDDLDATGSDEVSLTFQLRARPGKLLVSGDLLAKGSYPGPGAEGHGDLRIENHDTALYAAAGFTLSPAAADEGNKSHMSAMAAIGALARIRPREDFAESAAARLFGQGGAGALTTPLDWVLYRRRVRHDVGTGAVAAPKPDDRVQVWQARVANQDEAENVWKALRAGDLDKRMRVVAPVAFEADSERLRTPVDDIEDGWQQADGGDQVWAVGYLAQSGIEAQAPERLRSLADALHRVAPLMRPEDEALEVLHKPVPNAQPPGYDGAVFAVSVRSRSRRTECAELFTLSGVFDEETWGLVQEPVVGDVLAIMAQPGPIIVRRGEAVPRPDGTWKAPANFPPHDAPVEVVVWYGIAWTAGHDEDEAVKAARAILEDLGIELHGEVMPRQAEAGGDCPLWVFLRPLVQDNG